MNYYLIIGIESSICLLLIILFLVYRNKVNNVVEKNQTINEQIEKNEARLKSVREELTESKKKIQGIQQEIELNTKSLEKSADEKERTNAEVQKITKYLKKTKIEYNRLNDETTALQKLKVNSDKMKEELDSFSEQLKQVASDIVSKKEERIKSENTIKELMSRIDLYSRLDEFVSYGHFEEPAYLYETSARFTEEIKRVREQQKDFLKARTAVTYPPSISISSDKKKDKKILDGQVNLMLTSFNIDSDYLIGKVKPSTFARTLEQIEKLAAKLEKSAATLHCGFNTEYVRLKYEECKLQYQYTLKKQEEKEEQALIKEQMREEVKAQKEFERAIAEAEKEERMYRKMLERARQTLEKASEDERIVAQQRIEDLEQQLADAMAKEERAKSLAEQTRRGHVYVISNVGSFGEGIYKIGLTRRLDPMVRVKELGDASVPFRFDVHAIIHAEDAPALESSLHREFKHRRVNAVNFRKEFFTVGLPDIKKAVDGIVGNDVDFRMTALAEEYYESMRLQQEMTIQ